MWFIPLVGKISFLSLEVIVCTVLICNLIIANEKYEFNKQDKLFKFSAYFYWIHIWDKSFVSSVDGLDSWSMKQFDLSPLGHKLKINRSLHQCLISLAIVFFFLFCTWLMFCETRLRMQNATCNLLYISMPYPHIGTK